MFTTEHILQAIDARVLKLKNDNACHDTLSLNSTIGFRKRFMPVTYIDAKINCVGFQKRY